MKKKMSCIISLFLVIVVSASLYSPIYSYSKVDYTEDGVSYNKDFDSKGKWKYGNENSHSELRSESVTRWVNGELVNKIEDVWYVELHSWVTNNHKVLKQSTPTDNGKLVISCDRNCGAVKNVSFGWKLDDPTSEFYKSYNVIKHSIIYAKSKTVTVWLDNALKGSVVKVKIGKKVYSKKVGTKKKITIKIKKPKYGSKVSIGVYYKGKEIGKSYKKSNDVYDFYYPEYNEIVYYANKIKKGMKKQQVKYLYKWGPADYTAVASGGYEYWHYDNGSRVTFKKGKVVSWYKVN